MGTQVTIALVCVCAQFSSVNSEGHMLECKEQGLTPSRPNPNLTIFLPLAHDISKPTVTHEMRTCLPHLTRFLRHTPCTLTTLPVLSQLCDATLSWVSFFNLAPPISTLYWFLPPSTSESWFSTHSFWIAFFFSSCKCSLRSAICPYKFVSDVLFVEKFRQKKNSWNSTLNNHLNN